MLKIVLASGRMDSAITRSICQSFVRYRFLHCRIQRCTSTRSSTTRPSCSTAQHVHRVVLLYCTVIMTLNSEQSRSILFHMPVPQMSCPPSWTNANEHQRWFLNLYIDGILHGISGSELTSDGGHVRTARHRRRSHVTYTFFDSYEHVKESGVAAMKLLVVSRRSRTGQGA